MIVGEVTIASNLNGEQQRIALRDSILTQITGGKKPEAIANIQSFGAKGDGTTDCFPAFKKAMQRAKKRGGLHIVVPQGIYYLRGPITLVSNVCIELTEGATLKFDPSPDLYPLVSTSWEGTFLYNYSPMIYGYGLENISIIGKGTIDGNATSTFATWKPKQKPGQLLSRQQNHEERPLDERKFGKGYWLRPQLIQLYNCKGITLSGIKITSSPFWCVHLLKSENIICNGLRYDAKLINNDGIDPECSRNILIENIQFNNGDDNIAIKSGRDNDGRNSKSPSENIVIRNCFFKGLHAVVIGSEMSGGVSNIIVENCTYAGYCKRGIFIKTNPDRGGFVRNIFVKNCEFGDVEDLFYITSMYAGEGQNSHNYSTIERVYVDGVRCKNANAAAITLQGTNAKHISKVEFKNVEVDNAKIGISISKSDGVVFEDCHIGGHSGVPSQGTPQDKIFER